MHLYEEFGEEFAIKLNGAFIAAIWDHRRRRLILVNDRLGQYPLYYALYNGIFTFASGVRALLADPSLPRSTDKIAIAEFLTFDHILDDRTLIESVRLLPQASLLIYAENQLNIKPYWNFKYPDSYPILTEQEYMQKFLSCMEQAVKRQASHDDLPTGILLSGGLDSRFILAYLSDGSQRSPVHAFTWGLPDSDDARFAREIAKSLGVQHHFFELKPDWLLSKAQEAVLITDGMGNIVNMHALATLEPEAEYAKVIYKGFLGDAMMGFGLRYQLWAEYSEADFVSGHLQVHKDQGVITFNQAEQETLFSPNFRNEVKNAVFDAYVAGMHDSGASLLADQRNYFDFKQRVPRMTIKGVEVVRNRMMVRLPFCDNDLVEFSLTVPPGLRYERRLMKNAFIRTFPQLAQVPVSETGLPMTACARDVMIRANRVLRWRLHSMGLKGISLEERRPYKNYNLWFRTVLRPMVEETLLTPRSLERGYYNPNAIQQVVSDHMGGANHAGRLGALIAIEMWHRQFLD